MTRQIQPEVDRRAAARRPWSSVLLIPLLSAATLAVPCGPAGAAICANRITTANAVAPPGSRVVVPVAIAAVTDVAGINIRLVYDSSVLTSPKVERGWLLAGQHLLFSHSPEPGRLCAAAYSYDASPLLAREGTVLRLCFEVSPSAPEGSYPLSFATDGNLPSSGMTDLAGAGVGHMQIAGAVVVDASARPGFPYDIDRNGMVDGADLMLFRADWAESLTDSPCDFDVTGRVDEMDLLMFTVWWLYDYR